jgi:hypothetical protein
MERENISEPEREQTTHAALDLKFCEPECVLLKHKQEIKEGS